MKPTLTLLFSVLVCVPPGKAQVDPTGEFEYARRLLPEDVYDASVPTPESVLEFDVGDRAAFPDEILAVFRSLDEASPKARLFEYARSHEGRTLVYLAISSAANIDRIDEIKKGLARMGDPRGLSDADGRALLADLPATAWLAYSIHGDETSGADAAMLVAYHLVASQSETTRSWLDDIVILIDPMMNPDGRHRFLSQVQQHRGVAPNVDDQSLLHSGHWPWGRTNHYLFDLNRDWIYGVSPERRGSIRAASEWHPLLFVDAHEMGAQQTYLFSPDTEPLNLHFPDYLAPFAEKFGQDQAAAFDSFGWTYYSGEWADNWYPGYSTSWGRLKGAVSILYEQAAFAEDGVRRPEGTVITYKEAVHHQLVSSLANIATLYQSRDALKEGYLRDRRAAVSSSGPYANRTTAVLHVENGTRLQAFLALMDLQGIEYHVAEKSFTASSGRDMLGRPFANRAVPQGTILIPHAQPNARLAATLLEFDQRLPDEILKKERASVLSTGSGVMYDVTAWNVPMYYGLDALELDQPLPDVATRISKAPLATTTPPTSTVGYVINGTDDASVAVAARLMERDLHVRVATKEFELDGNKYERGSVLVLVTDNRNCNCDVREMVIETSKEVQLQPHGIRSGQGPGDLPDLGGKYFELLRRPSIALVARDRVNSYSFGSIWHAIDSKLGIRHSHLNAASLTSTDLERYNVVVLPDRRGSWDEAFLEKLRTWVEAGGTLVATGRSAFDLARKDSKLTDARLLRDVLGELDDYETLVHRELQATWKQIPATSSVWSHTPTSEGPPPWIASAARPAKDSLARHDQWRRLFMPDGAPLVAGRAHPEHWLTFGTGEWVSVLYSGSRVLMASTGSVPVRAGVILQKSGAAAARVGWSSVPTGYEIRVRQSGLLWPEASYRIANAALVTRERKGRGQVVLFAFEPTYRGTMHENTRMLFNAIVYGPGLGTAEEIDL